MTVGLLNKPNMQRRSNGRRMSTVDSDKSLGALLEPFVAFGLSLWRPDIPAVVCSGDCTGSLRP